MTPALRNTLELLVSMSKKGELGATNPDGCCVYHDGFGRYCAIGALLTEEMHRDLDDNDMNEGASAQDLWSHDAPFCWDIVAHLKSLGLNRKAAAALQNWHDAFFSPDTHAIKILLTGTELHDVLQAILDGYTLSNHPGQLFTEKPFPAITSGDLELTR